MKTFIKLCYSLSQNLQELPTTLRMKSRVLPTALNSRASCFPPLLPCSLPPSPWPPIIPAVSPAAPASAPLHYFLSLISTCAQFAPLLHPDLCVNIINYQRGLPGHPIKNHTFSILYLSALLKCNCSKQFSLSDYLLYIHLLVYYLASSLEYKLHKEFIHYYLGIISNPLMMAVSSRPLPKVRGCQGAREQRTTPILAAGSIFPTSVSKPHVSLLPYFP